MIWFVGVMAIGVYVLLSLITGDARRRALATKIGFVNDRHESVATLVEIVQSVLTPTPPEVATNKPTAEQIRAETVAKFDEAAEKSAPEIINQIQEEAKANPLAFGRAIRLMMSGNQPQDPTASPAAEAAKPLLEADLTTGGAPEVAEAS